MWFVRCTMQRMLVAYAADACTFTYLHPHRYIWLALVWVLLCDACRTAWVGSAFCVQCFSAGCIDRYALVCSFALLTLILELTLGILAGSATSLHVIVARVGTCARECLEPPSARSHEFF